MNEPENIDPEFVTSRTPQLTACDVELLFGALQIRVFDPVHVAVVSPTPQAILYSRFETDPVNPAALHVYVMAVFGDTFVVD